MRVLEWCVGPRPRRACRRGRRRGGRTAEQIALCSLQIRAIRADPAFAGGDYYDNDEGPVQGLAIARGMGQVTYRTAVGVRPALRSGGPRGRAALEGGRYRIESYLEHQGDTLIRRFDANSYVVLSEAMNHHDIGRGRGGIAAALAEVTARVSVVGIDSDRLYPVELQHEIARMLPGTLGHDRAVARGP